MTCLPFGLASAPAAFAKITNWVAHDLRQKGLRTVVYLDDFLLMHKNQEILKTQMEFAIKYLEDLGWQVNRQKLSTIPSKELEYLGITWNTEKNKKFLRRPENPLIVSEPYRLNRKRTVELARCKSYPRQTKLCVICGSLRAPTLQDTAQVSVAPPQSTQEIYNSQNCFIGTN